MTNSTFFSTTSDDTTVDFISAVIVRYGTEQVTVKISELEEDTTLEYLVNAYQEQLGLDPSRITSFRQDGKLIDKDSVVEPGAIYKVGISAESKANV